MDSIHLPNVLLQIDKPNTLSLRLHGVNFKIGLSSNNGSFGLQRISYPLPLELVKDFHPLLSNAFTVSQKRELELFTDSLKTLQSWNDPTEANSLFVDLMVQIDTLLETAVEHNTSGLSPLRKRYSEELVESQFPKKLKTLPQGDTDSYSDPDSSSEPKPFDPNNLVFKVPKNKPKNGAFAKQWKDHYAKLVKFREQFGHANVTRVSKGWEHLGSWVANQRRKLRKGKLTRQQYELLNEVGIEWDRSAYFKAGHHASSPM